MEFGWNEVIFLLIVSGAIYTISKVISSEYKTRKEKGKINKVINDPKLLMEKLNNPKMELDGKEETIKGVIDKGEKLKFDMKKNELTMTKEKIKINKEVKKTPKKDIQKKTR